MIKKDTIHYFFFFLIFFGLSKKFNAQDSILINGKVIDHLLNPVERAEINIIGYNKIFYTNEKGKFNINIPSRYNDSTIFFTKNGYSTISIKGISLIDKEVRIVLFKSSVVLNEIEINEKNKANTIEIIKKIIEKIPVNYSNRYQYNAYYKEIVEENNIPIYLSESDLLIKYSSSPCEYNSVAYLTWFDDMNKLYLNNPNQVFTNFQFWRYFPCKDDSVWVRASRAGDYNGENLTKYFPLGGPFDMLTIDKVKLEDDFLNEKCFNKYNYALNDTLIKNIPSYVIYFSPKDKKTNPSSDLSDKNENAFFSGYMYVTKKENAIYYINYSIDQTINGGFWASRLPEKAIFEIAYKSSGKKWSIDYLNSESQFTFKNSFNKSVTYKEKRFLKTNTFQKPKKELSNLLPIYHGMYIKMEDYLTKYDSVFWEKYYLVNNIEKDPYLANNESALKKQFASKNIYDSTIKPPNAYILPYKKIYFKDTLIDNYNWAESNVDTLAVYTKKEDEYAENYLNKIKNIRSNTADWLKFYYSDKNVKKDTLLLFNQTFTNKYYLRYVDSLLNPILYKISNDNNTDTIDLNKFNKYFHVKNISISPNDRIVCFIFENEKLDSTNLLFYEVQKKNLLLPKISQVDNFLWVNDTLGFFTTFNTQRNVNELFFITNGLKYYSIYKEADPRYEIKIKPSSSKKYVFIYLDSYFGNEVKYINTTSPLEIIDITNQRNSQSYKIDHYNNFFYKLTINDSIDNSVYRCKSSLSSDAWELIYSSQKGEYIKDFIVDSNKTILKVKNKLKCKAVIIDMLSLKRKEIVFDKKNNEFNFLKVENNKLFVVVNYHISQLVCEYNFETNDKQYSGKKNDFDNKYLVDVIWAKSLYDEVLIPITIIKPKNWKRQKKKPLLLYAYGAYGSELSAELTPENKYLLDNGFCIAYAHVRGGSELGHNWYLDGKLMKKQNSINDLISCAEFMVKRKYCNKELLFGDGSSAGSLIFASAVNIKPGLFRSIILEYPFLDVIGTLEKTQDPLSIEEQYEWGDISQFINYEYIKKYSPYQNLINTNLPDMYITTSLNDFQCPYWQVFKYVSKARKASGKKSLILLNIYENGGHFYFNNQSEYFNYQVNKLSFLIHYLD